MKDSTTRIGWIDNLRTVMILLVVLYHVGGVYEAAGLWGWFWIVDDPATITWVGLPGIVMDVMMMPILFFLSGYLTSAALKDRNGREFLIGRIKRLLVPWLVAVVTLIPIYKVIFLYSRGLPQEHWTTYFHVTNPNSQNWLWFLPVLFLFNLVSYFWSKTKIRLPRISLPLSVLAAFLIAVVTSFVIGGIAGFRTWTLTPIIDFENERLLVYLMAYLIGSLCFKQKVFSERPTAKTLYTIVSAIAWIPITVHIFARLIPFFYPEEFSVTPMYRLIWWLSFHASLLCLMYVMVQSFRRYLDRSGPVWSELSKNSYGVYVIHVVVIGVFGTLLLHRSLPATAKYPLLFVLSYGVSNLIVSASRALAQTVRSGSH